MRINAMRNALPQGFRTNLTSAAFLGTWMRTATNYLARSILARSGAAHANRTKQVVYGLDVRLDSGFRKSEVARGLSGQSRQISRTPGTTRSRYLRVLSNRAFRGL